MTYSDKLKDIAEGYASHLRDPEKILADLLDPFEMWPDVRSQVEKRFWQNDSFYQVIMEGISAYKRLRANIDYALAHQGNLAANFVGYPRSGKSTVARYMSRETHRIQFGTIKGWEEKVVFARSYSRATMELQRLTKAYREQGMSDAEIITKVKGYSLIEDENQIEREKDSVKAQTDMKTIAESCASAGIHFFYLSPERRGFGYMTIWVVGIDTKNQRNLSFYLSNDGECHGILITPNVPPFDKYTEMKNKVVVQTLVDGGRVEAVVKRVGQQALETKPVEIVAPPNADFMEILAISARNHLVTLNRSPEVIDRWMHRYFQGLTYKQIADLTDNARPDSVGKSVRDLDRAITNTMKGDILEKALLTYLNNRWQTTPTTPPKSSVGTPEKQPSSTDIWVRGWRECDVAIPWCVAVNCKLLLEHRPSWQLKCLPEAELLPNSSYLLLCMLGAPQPSVHIYPGTPIVDTGSVEEVAWEAWLERLNEHFVKVVARGVAVKRLLEAEPSERARKE